MLRFALPLMGLAIGLSACGGGALSVEEYQEWCRESGAEYEPFADGNRWHEASSQLDRFLEEAQGHEPPQELLGYHEASMSALADLKAVVEALDPDSTVNVFEIIDPLDAAAEQFGVASAALPVGLRAGIEEADCFAVAEPEALQHQ
jgi:hypothetical protein